MSSFAILPIPPARWRKDLFYYLQLVSAATSYTRGCNVCAGQREEYRAICRDLTTRLYSRLSIAVHARRTVLKTCNSVRWPF